MTGSAWDDVGRQCVFFLILFLRGMIDAVFLVLWVTLWWAANNAISQLTLVGKELLFVAVFQPISAVATLTPVLLYVYLDIRVMLIKTKLQLEVERKRLMKK